MARHGLTKIILFSGHGGNRYALPLFVQTLVEKRKPYTVYDAQLPFFSPPEGLLETEETGHACESETSTGLALHPELVKLDQAPPTPFTNLRRNAPLQEVGAYSPMDWYALYPAMYVGDPRKATAEKGEALLRPRVEALKALIRAVKADAITSQLQEEFRNRMERPTSPAVWME